LAILGIESFLLITYFLVFICVKDVFTSCLIVIALEKFELSINGLEANPLFFFAVERVQHPSDYIASLPALCFFFKHGLKETLGAHFQLHVCIPGLCWNVFTCPFFIFLTPSARNAPLLSPHFKGIMLLSATACLLPAGGCYSQTPQPQINWVTFAVVTF